MLSEAELIKGCKNFSRVAQKELYTRYSGKMRAVCLRYAGGYDEAQDILQEGFVKVFSNIGQYSGSGSLEGWIRRVMVNTAISFYHKSKRFSTESLDFEEMDVVEEETEPDALDLIHKAELSPEELIESLKILTDTYRAVFNMFYLENYSHKEIGEILGIDEKTSRTRLFRGRKQLQKHLYALCEKKLKEQAKYNIVTK